MTLEGKFLPQLTMPVFVLILYTIWISMLIPKDLNHSGKMPDLPIEETQANPYDLGINKTGYHIYVNLDELRLYLYKDGVIVKSYMVSGGKPQTPSPEGVWKIISKSDWGGSFGGSWMGFNVPWGKYGIHGTKDPWFIGKQNASHGCIRMYNDSARELYDTVPYGTPVTIVEKNRPFRVLRSGDVGSDVLKVQIALKKLGYFHDWASGKFEDNLKKSIVKFQKSNNYTVTGTVNKNLFDNIMQRYEQKLENETNGAENTFNFLY